MIFQKLKSLFIKTNQSPLYEVYTDGSYKHGRGSWAFVILKDGKVLKESSGSTRRTTCTRMEFQAAIEALQVLPENAEAILYTDSRILVDTMTLWLQEWKDYGWVKKNDRPIPGADQIQILDQLIQDRKIQWKWIKAHSGIVHNERCDELCIAARTI